MFPIYFPFKYATLSSTIYKSFSSIEILVVPFPSSFSSASKYGVKNNDVILELNGKKVNSAGTFIGELAAKRIGETVNLKVYSNGKEKNINVTLEKFK